MALVLSVLLGLAAGPAMAQNPNSCSSSGLSGYSYTATYNPGTDTTTYNFTFCNRSPIGGVYVNVGEIYLYNFPSPVGTPTAPPGWQFNEIGPRIFFSTTSNPWWQTPPAIKPGDCLSGFTYVISGMPDTDFVVFTHVQQVTDATGQTAEDSTWFDCSVEITPPVNEPCISIIKTANPVVVDPGESTTYSFEVCNCGNIALQVTSLDDSILGNLLDEFETANGDSSVLDIGDCVMFEVGYTPQAGDPNPLINCATVLAEEAEDDGGNEVDDFDCATVVINTAVEGPCVDLVKTVTPEQASRGDTVTYKYEICNCGSVPLTVTDIEDSNPTVNSLLQTYLANAGGSIPLAVDECKTIFADYQTQQTDVSPLLNCATVTAEDEEHNEVQSTYCARVDFVPAPSARQCFRPVTLTQELWRHFGEPGNVLFPNGLMFGRFAQAFSGFVAYGRPMSGCMVLGDPTIIGGRTIVFDGSYFGVKCLCDFMPQIGLPGKLLLNYRDPLCLDTVPGVGVTNSLAGEICALTMNIAYNDARCMPRNPGYDLEKFTLTSGLFKGKTVGAVLNIANSVLSGRPPQYYGLPTIGGYEALVDILRRINSNYAFLGYDDFIDRGYLKPNQPYGYSGPPHPLVIPCR